MGKLRTNGFTLIEVLISVLVLAIGVIGAARMQLAALRTSQQSAYQTAALQLAAEMAEKIRANQRQLASAGVANPYLSLDYKSSENTLTRPTVMCYTADCGSAELAKFDIYEWESRVKATLPGARVKICRDSKPWDSVAGALVWSCAAQAEVANAPVIIKIGWLGKGVKPDGRAGVDSAQSFPPVIALAVDPYFR